MAKLKFDEVKESEKVVNKEPVKTKTVSKTDEKLDVVIGALQNLTAGIGELIKSKPVEPKLSNEEIANAKVDKEIKEKKEAKAKKLAEANKIVYEANRSKYNNIQFTDHYFNEQQMADKNIKKGKLPIIHVP